MDGTAYRFVVVLFRPISPLVLLGSVFRLSPRPSLIFFSGKRRPDPLFFIGFPLDDSGSSVRAAPGGGDATMLEDERLCG